MFIVSYRIVIVSSHSHHKGQIYWKDVNFYKSNYGDGSRAYYQSKLANVMHAKELARRLSGTGINVYCLHPGTLLFLWHINRTMIHLAGLGWIS